MKMTPLEGIEFTTDDPIEKGIAASIEHFKKETITLENGA